MNVGGHGERKPVLDPPVTMGDIYESYIMEMCLELWGPTQMESGPVSFMKGTYRWMSGMYKDFVLGLEFMKL